MDRAATDIVGSFPVTENGNHYTLWSLEITSPSGLKPTPVPIFSRDGCKKIVFEFCSRLAIPCWLRLQKQHTCGVTTMLEEQQ